MDYYVNGYSKKSSDANAGTLSSPFKTVTHAIAMCSKADRILVVNKVYGDELDVEKYYEEDA